MGTENRFHLEDQSLPIVSGWPETYTEEDLEHHEWSAMSFLGQRRGEIPEGTGLNVKTHPNWAPFYSSNLIFPLSQTRSSAGIRIWLNLPTEPHLSFLLLPSSFVFSCPWLSPFIKLNHDPISLQSLPAYQSPHRNQPHCDRLPSV